MTFAKLILTGATLAGLMLAPLQAHAYDWGRSLGWTRNWEIYLNAGGGCLAARAGADPGDMLLLHLPPATGFQLAFVSHEPNETTIPAEITIDGWTRALNFYVSDGMAWEVADREMITRIGQGSAARLTFEDHSVPVSLAGTTAALLKMEDCWLELSRNMGMSASDARNSREFANLQADLAALKSTAATAPARNDEPPEEVPLIPRVVSILPAPAGPSCPMPGALSSPGSNQPATVSFFNSGGQPLTVYWLDFQGNRMEMMAVPAGQQRDINSYAGHHFIALDGMGNCHGGVMTAGPQGGTFGID